MYVLSKNKKSITSFHLKIALYFIGMPKQLLFEIIPNQLIFDASVVL